MSGAHNHHMLRVSIFPQLLVALHRCKVGWFARDEHQSKISGIFHMSGIFLFGKQINLCPHRRQMLLECLLLFFGRGGVGIVDKRSERHLAVDNQALAVGHEEREVGSEHRSLIVTNHLAIVVTSHLHLVVNVLLQAREIEDALQHPFSPVALNLVVTNQGIRQARSLLRDFLVGSHHFFELLVEDLRVDFLLILIFLKFLVQAINLLTQWSQQLIQPLLALLIHSLAAMAKQIGGNNLKSLPRLLLELLACACHSIESCLQRCFVAVECIFHLIERLNFTIQRLDRGIEFVDTQAHHSSRLTSRCMLRLDVSVLGHEHLGLACGALKLLPQVLVISLKLPLHSCRALAHEPGGDCCQQNDNCNRDNKNWCGNHECVILFIFMCKNTKNSLSCQASSKKSAHI